MHQQSMDIDQTYDAIKKLDENPTLDNFSSAFAVMLKNDSLNFKQQNMHNLFQNDVIRANRKILETMLNSKELIEYIEPKKIENSIDLCMKYWQLLKESKSTIKRKNDQIYPLLEYSKEWNNIITKQRALGRGQQMEDDEIEFIEYVCSAFKEWFKDESNIKSIKDKWNKLFVEFR